VEFDIVYLCRTVRGDRRQLHAVGSSGR
jgi:hypothetical protein